MRDKIGQTVRQLNSSNCKKKKKKEKREREREQVTACLRVAQVICESLQFICREVVIISQHKVLHRTPWPLHFPQSSNLYSLDTNWQEGSQVIVILWTSYFDISLVAKEEIKFCWVTDLTINHCAYNFFRNMWLRWLMKQDTINWLLWIISWF